MNTSRRMQYISQTRTTVVPVALYRGPAPLVHRSRTTGTGNRRPNDGSGYNYDHIDAYVLLHSKVVSGKLISPGGESSAFSFFPTSKAFPPRSPISSQHLRIRSSQRVPRRPAACRAKRVDGKLPTEASLNPLAKIFAEKNACNSRCIRRDKN